MNKNMINWFEIPVVNFGDSKRFYEKIFNITMHDSEMGEIRMGFFPYEPGSGEVSGAIVKGEGYVPSMEGVTLYLNGNPDLSVALDRVVDAGGSILMPKTQISAELGYMAMFTDPDSNRIALHSQA